MPLNGVLALDRVLAGQGKSGLAAAMLPALGSRLATALDLHADLKLYRALHAVPQPGLSTSGAGETGESAVAALKLALDRLQPAHLQAVMPAGSTVARNLAVAQEPVVPQALPTALHEALQACLVPQPEPEQQAGAGCERAEEYRLDFAPLKRYYLIQQRKLASNVSSLRQRLRTQLELASVAGQRLSALDEALEQGLQAHESALLARLPAVLEQLCVQRQQEFALTPLTAFFPSAPSSSHAPEEDELPPVLLACAVELQNLLAAEAELRLLPLRGLLANLS
ncbi:MAG: DUF3348 family protein [Thauera sp.]|nr:DUF3348 family protein [Thauera sp.]